MTKQERDNWITNIENCASVISRELGTTTVDFVFQQHGGHNVWDVNENDLPDIFSELYAIEADLN